MKNAIAVAVFLLANATVSVTAPAWVLTAEQDAELLPADGAARDRFGSGVAIDGNEGVFGPEAAAPMLGEYATSSVLVRLRNPLERRLEDGTFELVTGFPELDELIVAEGVHGIEYALRVSMRDPRNPDGLRRHGLDRMYKLHVPAGSDVPQLIEKLWRLPQVELAEPEVLGRAGDVMPNDPLFPSQTNLHQTSDHDIDAPEAWELTVGSDVIVAVIDSGVDCQHEDLPGNPPDDRCLDGYDFVDDDPDPSPSTDGHGTRTASQIAAITDNEVGMAGICWNCRLMPLKAWDGDTFEVSWLADAIVWATDHGARVINVSGSAGYDYAGIVGSAVLYAWDAGVVHASITQNQGLPAITIPAKYLEVIGVGATEPDDWWATFSNYSAMIDVVAPGVEILGAGLGGGYELATGTSRSAPQVAGLLALMESTNPSLGREEAKHLVRVGAEDQPSSDPPDPNDTPGFDTHFGWGRINMQRTLEATESAMSLRLGGGAATRVFYETTSDLADSYDFVRGDLATLSESAEGVDLGDVVCLDNDDADGDTAGNEDTELPESGEAFFYLGRPNGGPGAGSYGGSSLNRDRRVRSTEPSLLWVAEGSQPGEGFGASVAGAGNVNGDLYDDVIVGAVSFGNDQPNEGAAFVYLGSADGPQAVPVWQAEGNQTGSGFGTAVASAGDVNDDGYDDVIVGAYLHDNGETDEGRAWLYLGSPDGVEATPQWSAEGNQSGALFGHRVGTAGDVNDDGYDDVIVSSVLYDNGEVDEGRAYVYLGSASGLRANPSWTFESDQANARVIGVGTAGDVNNDGYDDVIVGSYFYDNLQNQEGRVFVFHGSPLGLPPAPATTLEIDVSEARFGYVTTTAGDVDNDGYDDVVVGAFGYTDEEVSEGAAFLFRGSASGVLTDPAWVFETQQPFSRGGIEAGAAGDVDNDGYDDVLVGADFYGVDHSNEGMVWVFRGSASGLSAEPDWLCSGGQGRAFAGWRAGGAGDVNGDLYDDVIVGLNGYDVDAGDEGNARVYEGPLLDATTSDCQTTGP